MNCYNKLCTEFYDVDKPVVPPEAFALYLRYAQEVDSPILEPMCGSGRFLIPLLERGFDIEGVDGSPHMLDACRRWCAGRGLRPLLHQQLMHELSLPRRYGLVFIPAGSFGLIEREHAPEALRRIRSLMLPHAKFVFELELHQSTEDYNGPWGGRWVQRPDGAKIIISWLTHYDGRQRVSRSIHRYDLIKDGRLLETEFEDFGGPAYDEPELRELLSRTGFKVSNLHPPGPGGGAGQDVIVECTIND